MKTIILVIAALIVGGCAYESMDDLYARTSTCEEVGDCDELHELITRREKRLDGRATCPHGSVEYGDGHGELECVPVGYAISRVNGINRW